MRKIRGQPRKRWLAEMLLSAMTGPVIAAFAEFWIPAVAAHFALTAGMISSAAVLFSLIHYLNRHDDPRRAKKPADPP